MAAPQQGGGQSDNSYGMLWGIAAVFAACGIVWYVFKSYIVYFFLTIKLYEVYILNSLSDNKFEKLQALIVASMRYTNNLTFADLMLIGGSVGGVVRYPLMLLMIILAVVIYFGNSTNIYKRTYSMKDFADLEKDNWPQISPVSGLDLIKTDLDTGPWAMALQPLQFCKRYKLIQEVMPQRREGVPRKEWNKIEVILKRGEANRVFAMQLGPLWNGVDRLPPHVRALFAVFAARINADSKAAADVLLRLNLSCKRSQLDMTGVDALLKKHLNTKPVEKITGSHAYVLTVMASMLAGAREDGVQASADFLWLKPKDRRLWYVLNTVGRQTPFVEVAGVFAHWKAEKEAGRKLLVPIVEEATNALELALKEIIYTPDEV